MNTTPDYNSSLVMFLSAAVIFTGNIAMTSPPSSEALLIGLTAGNGLASVELLQRYRLRFLVLMAREIGNRFSRREDPEDVVQSVWKSFFQEISEKDRKFESTRALWGMREKHSLTKISKLIEYQLANKRHPKGEAAFDGACFASQEPLLEEIAHVAGLIEQTLDNLSPPYLEIL
jgi:RNA polymerase sigma-70 factor, ECF subfamily